MVPSLFSAGDSTSARSDQGSDASTMGESVGRHGPARPQTRGKDVAAAFTGEQTAKMATFMSKVMIGVLPQLRIHPIHKWVRAMVADAVVVDTRRAIVVWEPRRVVASYAVPIDDISAELVPYVGGSGAESAVRMGRDGPPVLDPSTPFSVHSCPGLPLTLRTVDGVDLPGAAFAAEDPDLGGYVILDWDSFTRWYEEEQLVLGHPHDPFDRIDCLASSRRVVISAEGQVLADSTAATFLYETPLPVRYYLPRDDVRMELLTPTEHHSVCAYKGLASYWSATVDGTTLANIAWTYDEPLADAVPVRGLVAFFTERLDLRVEDVDLERPVTPWSWCPLTARLAVAAGDERLVVGRACQQGDGGGGPGAVYVVDLAGLAMGAGVIVATLPSRCQPRQSQPVEVRVADGVHVMAARATLSDDPIQSADLASVSFDELAAGQPGRRPSPGLLCEVIVQQTDPALGRPVDVGGDGDQPRWLDAQESVRLVGPPHAAEKPRRDTQQFKSVRAGPDGATTDERHIPGVVRATDRPFRRQPGHRWQAPSRHFPTRATDPSG